MGFLDELKDQLGLEPETGTITSAPSSHSKYYEGIDFSALDNTYGDIISKINDLEPVFLEMYQREKALNAWPDYAFIIRLSLDEAQRRANSHNNSILGNTNVNDLQNPHREPYILPFRVPQDASEGDEQAIDEASRSDTEAAIDEVTTAFKEVLDDGSLAQIDGLLRQLADTAETVEALIDTHDAAGFKTIRELFESWEGSDSDAGMEKFGGRLRPAAGLHFAITGTLLQGAIAECSAKATAQEQLGKAIDMVHEKVEELKTGSDTALKISARTAFNAIPWSGVLVSAADGASETFGGDDAAVSNWISGFFDLLEFEYELGLEPQQGSRLKSELLNAATSAKEDLLAARDEATTNLERDFGTWDSFYRTDPQVLIPGEKD